MSDFPFSIPLLIHEEIGIKRNREPVTTGIPLPIALTFDASQLALYNHKGEPVPLQTEVLARWSDGSIKWILLDFNILIDSKEYLEYRLKIDQGIKSDFFEKITLEKSENSIVVKNGCFDFFVDNTVFRPFSRVMHQNKMIIDSNESRVVLVDDAGRNHEPYVRNFSIETRGPLRTTFKIEGVFGAEPDPIANWTARLSFYAGSGFVEMKFTLHNPRAARHPGGLWDLGDEGSVYFRELAAHIALLADEETIPQWISHPCQSSATSAAGGLEIYQDSSGGQNWCSTNHVNQFGRMTQAFKGYRVIVGQEVVQEGERITPVVFVQGRESGIAATIDKFWQNFPKAIAGRDKKLSVKLFPGQHDNIYELQGGEQKTHTVFLQFHTGQKPANEMGWFHSRVLVRAMPEWYAGTKAMSYLTPLSADKRVTCQELINTAIDGPNTFFDKREVIDEYGWRHFGDLYADHEAVGQQGDKPLISHYNNQYDAIYGAIIQYARSGDARWFCLMRDLAKHVIDIDIYHTREDCPAYNGGLFWHTDHYVDAATATHRTYSRETLKTKPQSYGGGPSNEHNYTSGLLYYYYLTGDRSSYEAVQGLAEWVIAMDDGSHRLLGGLDRRPTGFASSTVNWDFHGPGRGGGNSINALLDAYVLTGELRYLVRVEELIRRCIHPKDDIEKRNLHDIEHRWSYTVFLQVIGKYLDVKVEKDQIDDMYSYARVSLLHYAKWMIEYEVPYKEVLDKVELPTETWPAQDIRKSNVFKFAAKYADEPLRSAFLQKAEAFFQACISDLLSFETCGLTRPIILLMSNTFMQAYFDMHAEETVPRPSREHDFGRPHNFTPQFYELYKAREKLRAVVGTMQAIRQRLSDKKSGHWS